MPGPTQFSDGLPCLYCLSFLYSNRTLAKVRQKGPYPKPGIQNHMVSKGTPWVFFVIAYFWQITDLRKILMTIDCLDNLTCYRGKYILAKSHEIPGLQSVREFGCKSRNPSRPSGSTSHAKCCEEIKEAVL